MSLRIKITKWFDERSVSPEIAVLVSDDDRVWRLDADLLEQEAVDLPEALFVNPGGAIRIDIERGAPSLKRIADELPKTLEYIGWSTDWGLETGDDAIDALCDDGGMRVLIDGDRWGLFEISGLDDSVREFNWFPCYPNYEKAQPSGRTIAYCSGIESASRTSGYFCYWVLELDDDNVAFCVDLDEDGFSLSIERRAGRSDVEIARTLRGYVDWPPVELALDRAIASEGYFDGVASELDPEMSETCEVSAEVSFLPDS